MQIDGTNGIGKLFGGDDDDIQVYRANRVRIYYLHSRGPSKADAVRASPYLCRACSWPLLDSDKRFCSISCKVSRGNPQPPSLLAGRISEWLPQ